MVFCTLLLVTAALALVACGDVPEFAPPPQRPSFEGFRPHLPARLVDMSDPDAPQHFVRDILSDGTASWRWTGQHPEVRVRTSPDAPLKYTIDFTLPEVTFKKTGPVNISFLVNGRVLGKERYAHAGAFHFEKPVPPDWLTAGQDATAGASVDKMWISPDGADRYGFILSRIGFIE